MRLFGRTLPLSSRPCRAHGPRGIRSRRLPLVLLATIALGCLPDSPADGIPTHPSDRFSVTFAWHAPVTDAMGNTLGDLAGFRLYHCASMPPNGPDGTMIDVGDTTEFTVENLEAGTYYFAVSAVDKAGNESDLSKELRVEVGGP